MAEGNGSPVTWREQNLVLDSLDKRFASVEADIAEIKWGMNLVLENRKARWRAWGPPIVAALIAALVAALVALLIQ